MTGTRSWSPRARCAGSTPPTAGAPPSRSTGGSRHRSSPPAARYLRGGGRERKRRRNRSGSGSPPPPRTVPGSPPKRRNGSSSARSGTPTSPATPATRAISKVLIPALRPSVLRDVLSEVRLADVPERREARVRQRDVRVHERGHDEGGGERADRGEGEPGPARGDPRPRRGPRHPTEDAGGGPEVPQRRGVPGDATDPRPGRAHDADLPVREVLPHMARILIDEIRGRLS